MVVSCEKFVEHGNFFPSPSEMDGLEQQVVDFSQTSTKSLRIPIIAGGVAGMFTDITLFPLDTVKTRLQQGNQGLSFRGLYQGLGPAAIASAPSAAIFFGTYEFMKRQLATGSPDSVLVNGAAAGVGEVAACLFKVPFEVVKQRLQVEQSQSTRKSVTCMISNIYRTQGLRGCYSGLVATLMREIPFGFIQMPVYEILKSYVLRRTGTLTSVQACACGAVAGGISAAVTCPIDVWKTRLMLGNPNSTIASIYRAEGLRALFSGLTPRVLWISVGGSIFFGAYEFVGDRLKYMC